MERVELTVALLVGLFDVKADCLALRQDSGSLGFSIRKLGFGTGKPGTRSKQDAEMTGRAILSLCGTHLSLCLNLLSHSGLSFLTLILVMLAVGP